jgi:D-3-phosphoglycerate dehydrogenase
MRPHAYLLNASRGAVVDLKALREALESGHISGAAVDVFPQEPAGESDPFVCALQGLDNVILTPHIGGSTLEAQQNIGHEVAGAVARFLDVGTTIGCVTLPQLDAPRPSFPAHIRASRLINIHRNVPGVLSRINRVIAESEINIAGQSLATLDEVGLAIVDMPVAPDDPRAQALCDAIAQLDTSLRSRMLELVM